MSILLTFPLFEFDFIKFSNAGTDGAECSGRSMPNPSANVAASPVSLIELYIVNPPWFKSKNTQPDKSFHNHYITYFLRSCHFKFLADR